jgi:hypothetical protein
VPIEPAIAPLLEVLAEQSADGNALLRVPPPEDCAELVRKDLLAAGCEREELFADDAERQHFTFHGLRHTCITHWAVAGRPVQWLAAAGHTDLATTQGYVDTGILLRGSFGRPHPPIPDALVREVLANTVWNTVSGPSKLPKLLRPQRELNPIGPADPVATALVAALTVAVNARRWSLVARLATELDALQQERARG